MNYLRDAVRRFMKDAVLKPYEYFHIHYDADKLGYKVSESLRMFTVGYFTEDYRFSIMDTLKKNMSAETEGFILSHILSGDISVVPVERFLPEVNEIYYYLERDKFSCPETIDAHRVAWEDTLDDYARYALGNCFRSEKEAYAMLENNFYIDVCARHNARVAEHKAKAFAVAE